eukprot:scaffold23627_cov18-Prasinocladus_malaysianus.AAC.2
MRRSLVRVEIGGYWAAPKHCRPHAMQQSAHWGCMFFSPIDNEVNDACSTSEAPQDLIAQ